MTSDLLTHGLQGSQIALHLQAAEQAQQQQQQANGASAVAGTHTLAAMTQPVSANPSEFGGLPHQATGPAGQADTAYQHASAAVGAGLNLHAAHLQSGVQQQQQQLPNEQVTPHGSVAAVPPGVHAQQHTAGMYAASGSTSDAVNVSNGMPGNESDLASPDIGLKLGQVHSPRLSEDVLGGDQVFMDAMQATAGQMHATSHPYCRVS